MRRVTVLGADRRAAGLEFYVNRSGVPCRCFEGRQSDRAILFGIDNLYHVTTGREDVGLEGLGIEAERVDELAGRYFENLNDRVVRAGPC